MKKLSILLLVLAMIVCVFTACGNDALEGAKEYLKAMYVESDGSVTPADYTLVALLKVDGATYTVDWTSDKEEVKIVKAEDGKTVTVDIDENATADLEYTLTATIKDAEGETITWTIKHTVPAYRVNTWDEYNAAENDAPLVVQGVVTAIIGASTDSSNNCLYVQDGKGGYYVYGLKEDPAAGGIKIGMTVEVKGKKDNYNGTLELKDSTVEVIDTTIKTITPADYTEIYKAAANLKAADLVKYQGALVTIKGVELQAQSDADKSGGYFRFTLGGKSSYVRHSGSTSPINKTEKAAFIEAFESHIGYTADVTGIICVYDGAFYLLPVSADAYTNYQLPARDDAGKVDYEKGNLTFTDNITESGEITLPVAGPTYTDVVISWASDNACAVVDGGKLTVTLPETATTIKLTATLSCNGKTATKEFTVAVDAATTTQYIPSFVTSAPAAGKYTFAMDQSAVDGFGILYATGVINSKGALETTDKAAKAALFDIAVVDGGYTIKLGDKFLEGYLSGTFKNLRFVDSSTAVWTWNADANVFTFDIGGAACYFGTYLKDGTPRSDTMSFSEVTYITGDNLSKIDVSQFVGHLTTLTEAVDTAVPVTSAPAAGDYIFAMNQSAFTGFGWLYAAGTIDSKGALETTDKIGKAAIFTIAVVDGGYTIKIGDKYLEGYLNGTFKNLRLVDSSTAVWTWNAEANVFTCDIDGTAYYFGSYTNKGSEPKNTMALSAVTYITGDNLSKIDVSQFVGHLCEVKLLPKGEDTTPPAGGGESGGESGGETGGETGGTTPTYTEMTIAQALAAANDSNVKISGIVCRIDTPYSEEHNNITVTITDGTNEIKLFRLVGNYALDDIITVEGTITVYSSLNQIAAGATATKTGTHTCTSFTTLANKCDDCGKITTHTCADANTDSKCDLCGEAFIVGGEADAVVSFTVSANRTSYSADSEVWAADNATITHTKGSTNLRDTVENSDSSLRVYGNATLKVAYTGITKIVIEAEASYAQNADRLASITATGGATVNVVGNSVIITLSAAANEVTITNTHGSQIRIVSVSVYAE